MKYAFVGCAIFWLVVIASSVAGYKLGWKDGVQESVAAAYGDKWDCAYSQSTGFLMCDRTPKYKD